MQRTLDIPYQVLQADSDSERRALEQRSGRSTLPQVFINGQSIGAWLVQAQQWVEILHSTDPIKAALPVQKVHALASLFQQK